MPIEALRAFRVLLIAVALCAASDNFANARARGYSVLHAFGSSPDGSSPYASLVADTQGNLYGTTVSGGSETVLYTFSGGKDGAYPSDTLLIDREGNLIGATDAGGSQSCEDGCGVIFELSTKGRYSTLYTFTSVQDGNGLSPLIEDSQDNLYGTTVVGGSGSAGTVFRLAPNGTKTILYSFSGSGDGANPIGGVIADAAGNLYGVTETGGVICDPVAKRDCGTVFKLAPNGIKTTLHAFTGGSDGALPEADLILDSAGGLYGTTAGGTGTNCSKCGRGTVFRISPDGTESVLHAFSGGSDGDAPLSTPVFDKDQNNLFGTTYWGGGSNCHAKGCGTVFRVSTDGTETVLHSFSKGQGANPHAGLVRVKRAYYGTTTDGGINCGGTGCGVVFKLFPPR